MKTCFGLPRQSAIARSSSPVLLGRGFFALATAATLLASASASAATVAYWRFEDGAITTDSAGSNDLTNSGVSSFALPASGDGSAFSDPIPQTGAANGQAIDVVPGNYMYAADDSAFTFGTAMTVEGYFNADTVGGYLVSQWDSESSPAGTSNSSWGVGLSSGVIRVAIGGSGGKNFTSLSVAADTDYYFAMTYDAGSVTVYLQDLTNGSAMTSQSIAYTTTTLHDSAAEVTIGGLTGNTGTGVNGGTTYNGLLDEIRLSNTVLSESEFLVSVPEPSSAALLLGAGCLMFLAGSRRRR